MIRAVCWDWNGTLLDDVDRCVRVMNDTLAAFGKPPLPDVGRYRQMFRFPLRAFYADAGIGDEEYHHAVDRYLQLLADDDGHVPLQVGARETIAALRDLGCLQVLASATRQPLLASQLSAHDLAAEFDEVLSITDVHDASKRDVIADWLSRSGLAPHEVLMVGDTNHDHEIAEALGTAFVHFSRGHQALGPSADVVRVSELSALLGLIEQA